MGCWKRAEIRKIIRNWDKEHGPIPIELTDNRSRSNRNDQDRLDVADRFLNKTTGTSTHFAAPTRTPTSSLDHLKLETVDCLDGIHRGSIRTSSRLPEERIVERVPNHKYLPVHCKCFERGGRRFLGQSFPHPM